MCKYTRSLWPALLGAMLISFQVKAGETELDLDVSAGYDDNPYRLSVNEKSGGFVEFDASLDYDADVGDVSAFFLEVDADASRFSGGAKDASDMVTAVHTGFEFDWRTGNRNRYRLEIGAGTRLRRGTFVSRFTGEIGTIGTTEIPDRFDYDRADVFANSDYYLGDNLKLSLDLDYRDKDYVEDYAILGADRLDNKETSIAPSLRYDVSDQWRVTVFGDFKVREYVNRTNDDATGNPIPGSNREYDYSEIGMALEFQGRDDRQWEFGLSSGDRKDNGVGYWDYDMEDYYVRIEQDFRTDASLSVEVYRTSKEYASVIQTANPEEQYERTGNGIDLRFEHGLGAQASSGLALFAEFDYFDGSASSARSAYKRGILLVGITKTFASPD